MRILGYLAATLVVPAIVAPAIAWRGPWLFLVPVVLFAAVPLLDHVFAQDEWNPDPERPPNAWPWRLLSRSWVPVQTALLAWGLWTVARVEMSGWERALLVVDLGIMAGSIGITFGHELMHRTTRVDRALAEILMAEVGYTWFCVEHVHGHHKRVGTPDDPATSRLGETLYAFLPRTLIGGLRSAWAFERERVARRRWRPWDLRNRIVRYALGLVLLQVGVALWLGGLGWLAWFGQAAIAVIMLESINYVEHYGLQRARVGERNGRAVFERVREEHSWNSAHAVSNRMLLNLARHSDHHAHASRPCEDLRHMPDAPQLPSGYAGMFLMAWVPPLWFAVMNPRVRDWQQRHGGGADDQYAVVRSTG
ncbi:MAG: hypothetical protein RIT45_4287 [Pseudomonadota bacterium]